MDPYFPACVRPHTRASLKAQFKTDIYETWHRLISIPRLLKHREIIAELKTQVLLNGVKT